MTSRETLRRTARDLQGRILMRFRHPVELALTATLRRLARRRPDVFERLGEFQREAFVIAPRELAICFRLLPSGPLGSIRVVPEDDIGPFCARVSGSLPTLLRLFDGTSDADAAFFSRAITVEGETGAVMALRNSLEAAELDIADLAGFAAPALRRFLQLAERLRFRSGALAAG